MNALSNTLSVKLLLALSLVAGLAPTAAADSESTKTVGGVTIYVGMLPSELIEGHPAGHPEARMHRGGRGDGRKQHLVVALFDAQTGARITDAEVSASVDEPGTHDPKKPLEPMQIAGTVTYGNFFDIANPGDYLIRVEVRRPGVPDAISADFKYSGVE